jgi:hypothetical protein
MNSSLTLAEIHRIRSWHLAHKDEHPIEYQLWDCVLCSWLMGWVGWLPLFIFEAVWIAPLCLLGCWAPRLYVAWRRHAHRLQRLRCDWLGDKP